MSVEIRRLGQDDLLKPFSCGDNALDSYLKRHAWINQQQNLVGVTYIAADESNPKTVVGYYTLATSSIPRGSLPLEMTQSMPRYPNLPVALLARLAVDRRFQQSGLGRRLLSHAFENVLNFSKQIGCRYLVVDAYSTAVGWYAKYGFIAIDGPTVGGVQPMFIDLKTLQAASG